MTDYRIYSMKYKVSEKLQMKEHVPTSQGPGKQIYFVFFDQRER